MLIFLNQQGLTVRNLGRESQYGLARRAIMTLVRKMRDHSGQVDFIGLTRMVLIMALMNGIGCGL